jgi:hypothetical protein
VAVISDFTDRDEVGRFVAELRERLEAGDLDEHAAAATRAIGGDTSDPVGAMLAALPAGGAGDPSSGGADVDSPFFSREPIVSLMQTSLEIAARDGGIVHEPEHRGRFGHIAGLVEELDEKHLPAKFSTHDPGWVAMIGAATLERLAKGNHPFNRVPAEYEVKEDDARIVVVGDWGSGLPRARAVAGYMAEEVTEALAGGRPVHVVHLGDVYYSGDPDEIRRRVLAEGMWPVSADQCRAGAGSWALNGNHDMYGGGWGFFETLLGDARFARQRSPDGQPTSFFRISTPSWDLVGLDTSWDPRVLCKGLTGGLADPQGDVLRGWAAESERRLMLLSHHQFVTAYDPGDIGTVIGSKLQPLLASRRIAAWLWGHEHRCMSFDGKDTGIPFTSCIGHGGIPIPASPDGARIPPPGLWQIPMPGDRNGVFEENAKTWNKFGFAVVDLAGPKATIRYRDDEGIQRGYEQIA